MKYQQIDLLKACAHIPGLTGGRLRQLRDYCKGIADYDAISIDELIRELGWSPQLARRYGEWRTNGFHLRELERTKALGISQVFRGEKNYPQELLTITDPPECLFYRGVLPTAPKIALVGSRKNTQYGRKCLEYLIPYLQHFTTVSGLALGVDGIVHEFSLEKSIPTLAVLGTGIDDATIYPREHLKLAHGIIENGGCVLSEYPPYTPSRKEHFPQRNRIIAGLSLATIVIEAGADSGSLITARLALEQGREVLAIPGPIWSQQSRGCHQLIKMGARLCDSIDDVLDALRLDRPQTVTQTRKELPLTPEEQKIYQVLEESSDVDRLCGKTQLRSTHVLSALSMLELKGYIKKEQGLWHRSIHRPL